MFPQQYCRLQYYFSVIQRETYFQTVNTKQLWNITSHIKIKINIKTLTFFQQIKNKAQSQTCLSLSFHDIQYIWIICSAVLSFIDLTDFFLMEVPQIRRRLKKVYITEMSESVRKVILIMWAREHSVANIFLVLFCFIK